MSFLFLAHTQSDSEKIKHGAQQAYAQCELQRTAKRVRVRRKPCWPALCYEKKMKRKDKDEHEEHEGIPEARGTNW